MNTYKNRFYCFSPPVMIATFAIELGLAAYIVWKYRTLALTRVIVATLLCLATFQLAEWMVCQGAIGISGIDWARIGFVAISFLPPLGIHIATTLAGRQLSYLQYGAYAAAVGFSAYFLASTQGITGSVCGGNYVIFQVAPQAVRLFALYYYSLLIIGVGHAFLLAQKTKNVHISSALKGLTVGYLSFMLPTITVYLRDNASGSGIPSVMCGFAVLLAFVLVFWVLPRYTESLGSETVDKPLRPART